MVCYTTCSVALVVLFSMVYMTVMVDTQSLTNNLQSKLTPEESQKYLSIVDERKKLYLQGFSLGFLVSMVALYLMKSETKMNTMTMVCLTIVISYLVMYFYYTLMPKQDLLVVHLNNPEARMAWMKYYQTMKTNYHVSMLLGVVFVGLFSNGLCQ